MTDINEIARKTHGVKAVVKMIGAGGHYVCDVYSLAGVDGFFFEFTPSVFYHMYPDRKTSADDFEWVTVQGSGDQLPLVVKSLYPE